MAEKTTAVNTAQQTPPENQPATPAAETVGTDTDVEQRRADSASFERDDVDEEKKQGDGAPPPPGPPPGMAPSDFPDGGAKAWLCVFGAWCGTLTLLHGSMSFAVDNG